MNAINGDNSVLQDLPATCAPKSDEIHDFEALIAEYTEVIRHNPTDAAAYHRRGFAYNRKGEFQMPSPTAWKRSGSTRTIVWPTGSSEARLFRPATTMRPSPAARRRSSSIRVTPRPTGFAVTPITARATTTGPSPTIRRRSGSTRTIISPMQPRRGVHRQRRLGSGHRRLHGSHSTSAGKRLGLCLSRHAHYGMGDFDQGIADCTVAIELDPQNAWAYVRRGNAHHENGDFDEAIADYTAAIRLDPNNAGNYCDRGFTYWSMGEFDQAIADCSEAIRLDPHMASAYAYRGAAHRRNGNFEQAVADCTEVIRLQPQSAAAYRRRGVVYETKGDRSWPPPISSGPCNSSTRKGNRHSGGHSLKLNVWLTSRHSRVPSGSQSV